MQVAVCAEPGTLLCPELWSLLAAVKSATTQVNELIIVVSSSINESGSNKSAVVALSLNAF